MTRIAIGRPGASLSTGLIFSITVALLLEVYFVLGIRISTGLRLHLLAVPFLCTAGIAGYALMRTDLARMWSRTEQRFSVAFLGANISLLLVCAAISHPGLKFDPEVNLSHIRSFLALGVYVCAAPCLVLAFFPWRAIRDFAWNTRVVWLWGIAGALLSRLLSGEIVSLWDRSSSSLVLLTFRGVQMVLGIILPHVDSDPGSLRIGSPDFHVTIEGGCSGVEGLGLILILSVAWLWFFRSEIRYPRALLLIPAVLLTTWLSNIVRISTLILIGNAGAKAVAIGGFHSYAGWISVNSIALVFCGAVGRSPWLLKHSTPSQAAVGQRNPTAVYLMPFLAILAASFVSGAMSGGFEWSYPLRFLAAGVMLWYFRKEYWTMCWSVGWISPVLGALVFAGWVALAHASPHIPEPAFLSGLNALSPAARWAWLVIRFGAAMVTVPLAEELAFRGYAARRLMTVDFDQAGLGSISWSGIVGSSLLFGMMHGTQWVAGTLAGLIYALAVRRRGSIGDGVVAHATTNMLLAAWVLWSGDWSVW